MNFITVKQLHTDKMLIINKNHIVMVKEAKNDTVKIYLSGNDIPLEVRESIYKIEKTLL